MAKAAPAKHKIRVASHSLSRRVASAQPAASFVQNTNRIVQWRRKNDQNAMPANGPTDKWYGKGAAPILFAAALPLPAAICAPPSSPPRLLCTISYIFVISAARAGQRRAKSCKLMATGAHSKRFHYCHKLRQLRLRRRRLREIALKNFPAVLFDFRYVIFK